MAGSPRFSHYSFGEITVAFGPILIDGYADGAGITIEWTNDAFTMKSGTDGKVVRSKMLDQSATITLHLMSTSATNDELSVVALLDRAAPNGAGVGPLLIKDNNGRSLYTAAECWISRMPDAEFDREAGQRDWVLQCAFLEAFTGGN